MYRKMLTLIGLATLVAGCTDKIEVQGSHAASGAAEAKQDSLTGSDVPPSGVGVRVEEVEMQSPVELD